MTASLLPPRRMGPDGTVRYESSYSHVLQPALARLQTSDDVGYLVGDRAITFRDVGRDAARVAAAIRGADVEIGEPVALSGPPTFSWVASAFGTLAAGAALTPLDHNLTASEREAMTERAGIRFQVQCDGAPELGIRTIAPAPSEQGSLTLTGRGHDLAVILHTSGSTGPPKAVQLTHDNLVQSLHSFVDVFGCRPGDRTCIAVPLFHVTGLVDQLLHMLWLGGTSRLLARYSTAGMLESLVEDAITVMFAVPTVFALLTRNPPADPLALRLAVYGGSPIGRPTIDALLELVPGARPVQGYGMTEMTSLATALPEAALHTEPMSVGVPSPITQLRVVADDGTECPPGHIGEILMRGPHRTPGYRYDPDATRAAIDAEGWLHSGDLAWRSEQGLLYLAGRRTEIINRGGEKVSPREIESALCDVAGVTEAVAFSLPDDLFYEVPAAAVVVDPGSAPDVPALQEAIAPRLAPFKRPVAIAIVDAVPLGANGKPDVAVLRSCVQRNERCRKP